MNIDEIRAIIIKEETEFPKRFTSFEERDYGILFFNTDAPESNDSNHAVLFPEKIADLPRVLYEIADFYTAKGLRAHFSIYHPFVENYFIDNAEIFKECGYAITLYGDIRIMLLTEANEIDVPYRLEIRHITAWSDAIGQDILAVNGGKEHFLEVNKNSMGEGNYLFIGYLRDEPVSLLSFCVTDKFTRFEEMATAEKHRGSGYAREMNRFAVNYVREHGFPLAYQWPAHDTSERITTQVGFRFAFPLPAGSAKLAK